MPAPRSGNSFEMQRCCMRERPFTRCRRGCISGISVSWTRSSSCRKGDEPATHFAVEPALELQAGLGQRGIEFVPIGEDAHRELVLPAAPYGLVLDLSVDDTILGPLDPQMRGHVAELRRTLFRAPTQRESLDDYQVCMPKAGLEEGPPLTAGALIRLLASSAASKRRRRSSCSMRAQIVSAS